MLPRKTISKHLQRYGPAPQNLGEAAEAQQVPNHNPFDGGNPRRLPNREEVAFHNVNLPEPVPHDPPEAPPLPALHENMILGPAHVHAQVPIHVGPPDTNWTHAIMPDGRDAADDMDPDDVAPMTPPAYTSEPSHIRMVYLQAVISNIIGKIPVRFTNELLRLTLSILKVTHSIPLTPSPVTSLASAKRRLGIDPDQWIIQYAICSRCWKHYSPQEVDQLANPLCTSAECPDPKPIYEVVSVDSNGKEKRRAIKISPQVSLIQSIRRMVRRKGFRKLIRDSRNIPAGRNDDPDYVMKDMHDAEIWSSLRTGIKREVGNHGTVRDVPLGDDTEKKITDHRFGLHMSVNLDWFGALENRPHSSGPIYIAFNDLPRDQRYLQVNVICLVITPGPTEPTSDQLNYCMESFVRDVNALKNGIEMEVYDEDDTELVQEMIYADCCCNNNDTPAARKMSGFGGHSADINPCPWCACTLVDINRPQGYAIDSFALVNEATILKQKFYSRDAPAERQATILEHHGVRWSALDWIPGWRPSKQTALDFMHCIFLGVVAFLFTRILFAAHMFPGAGGENSAKRRFENAINSIRWPSHVTRLPKNLGENQSLKKADEWRRLLNVAPVILWLSWRDQTDEIPDAEPPISANEKITTTHSRKMRSLYETILLLCAGVRLLSTKSISMAQAAAGQMYLANYCRGMLLLGVVLTINHHLAMHFAAMIKTFGPVYAWWLFAFERFNGMLERVNLNGHDGGRIELTMLRSWVQSHLLYELLLGLPDNATNEERDMINQIINADAQRGGMAVEIAIYRSEASVDNVSLPKSLSKTINLHQGNLRGQGANGTDLYSLLYDYAVARWPMLQLRREFSVQPGQPFIGTKVARRLPYVRKDGLRYGCKSNSRSEADSFAFVQKNGERVPVSIEDLFLLKIPDTDAPAHACALIRRLQSDDTIPQMPWQIYASVLGIHASFAEQYHPYEIISASEIDCPLALIPVTLATGVKLWVSVSFDHSAAEPELPFDENDGD